jgi:hypothetical protein
MARAPKPWKLSEEETLSSYNAWKNNLLYYCKCDDDFCPFVQRDAKWTKISPDSPTRGLVDDTTGAKLTAAKKLMHLERMLGFISQYVPHFLATDITENSTSMNSIWLTIRKYYNFKQSESQFMKFTSISREEGERPERLFQRIIAHLQDNLLKTDSNMQYDGQDVATNEIMSPTVYRLAVLRWMELIDPKLPAIVQRSFANDLQSKSLKDLQPQICDALDGFLEELRSDEIRASRAYVPDYSRRNQSSDYSRRNQSSKWQRPTPPYKPNTSRNATKPFPNRSKLECRVCKAEGRAYSNHNMANCDYVSKAERRDLVKSFRVEADDNLQDELEYLADEADELHLDDHDQT